MRRTWLSIALVASSLSMGSDHLHAQSPRCDAPHSSHASCTECRDHSGVYIPSLQFLVVDRLSAAGDRLERSFKSAPSRIPVRTCKPKPVTARREASCGIERLPAHPCHCDQLAAKGKIGHRSPSSGSISDIHEESTPSAVPPAPSAPSAAPPAPSAPSAVPPAPSAPSAVPPAPFSPPKLLPTPVSSSSPPADSKQADEPKLTDIPGLTSLPEVPSNLPADPSTREGGELPRVENVPIPAPPEQPLPDILVDPFIEDVGNWRNTGDLGVVRTSATRPVPVNPLRGGGNSAGRQTGEPDLPTIRTSEPKRLTPQQKRESESAPAQGNSSRTILLRSFANQAKN
jgi:hypothetical protein